MSPIETLKEKYELSVTDSYDGVCFLKNDRLWIQWIEPHKGTNFQYCLRAEFPETFDRWSVSLFEEDFSLENFNDILVKLDSFISSREEFI